MLPPGRAKRVDKACANRVAASSEDDRNGSLLLSLTLRTAGSGDDDDGDVEAQPAHRQDSAAARHAFRPSVSMRNIAALDPTDFAKALRGNCRVCRRPHRFSGRTMMITADARHLLSLLRPRRERPRCRRAAEQRDELAPL